ncbi:MAG TPA: hypothetical protein VH877_23255 [Polyangia bacterium]|jgi:hypothetical protein|nr:hypothetical protein [Polyangia bacterium]
MDLRRVGVVAVILCASAAGSRADDEGWREPPIVIPAVPRGSGFRLVGGKIMPEHFKFYVKVPHDPHKPGTGGWKEACVHARMRDAETGRSILCRFQTGVPIVNEDQGFISDDFARQEAAEAANIAAYTVLMKGTPVGIACRPFMDLMQVVLNKKLYGARVYPCDGKVPPISFDPGD